MSNASSISLATSCNLFCILGNLDPPDVIFSQYTSAKLILRVMFKSNRDFFTLGASHLSNFSTNVTPQQRSTFVLRCYFLLSSIRSVPEHAALCLKPPSQADSGTAPESRNDCVFTNQNELGFGVKCSRN